MYGKANGRVGGSYGQFGFQAGCERQSNNHIMFKILIDSPPVSGYEWRVGNIVARLYAALVTDSEQHPTWCHPTMFTSGQRSWREEKLEN